MSANGYRLAPKFCLPLVKTFSLNYQIFYKNSIISSIPFFNKNTNIITKLGKDAIKKWDKTTHASINTKETMI